MYSSPIVLACWSASLMTATVARAYDGDCVVEPLMDGSRLSSASLSCRTRSRSAPAAVMSAAGTLSSWASSAPRTWAGSTAGFPAAVASWMAAPRASWLRRGKLLAAMDVLVPLVRW